MKHRATLQSRTADGQTTMYNYVWEQKDKNMDPKVSWKIQGVSKKSGISKWLTFCCIARVLSSSRQNYLSFHNILFIAVILSIIDYQSSKRCLRYEYDFLHR
jgi:hypothetical protein